MKTFRLSPQQRRLWRLGSGDCAYRSQCALDFDGAADGEALRQALRRVVARHEILRTTFGTDDLALSSQRVAEEAEPAWREAGPLPPGGLTALLGAERRATFDLSAGPLLHACFARLEEGGHVLVLTLPALCADRLSLLNLAEEVVAFYRGESSGVAEAIPMQYARYAEWQNGLLEDDDAEEGRSYWRSLELSRLPPLTLPYATTELTELEPDAVAVELAGGLSARIDAAAAAAEISPAELLLAFWQALLYRFTGQPDLVIGVACSGREYEILAGVIGPITRYLPVRVQVGSDLRIGELGRLSRDQLSAARDWQETFEGEDTVFTALFDFDEIPTLGSAREVATCGEPFLVRLIGSRRGGRLALEIGYDSRRLAAAAASRLAGAFAQLLAEGLVKPDAPIRELPVVGERERHEMGVDWNRTARELPGAECVQNLFTEQARRSPERLAVLCGEKSLSYGELQAGSNRLAHLLRRHGVGPEVRVALLLDRSLDMVSAIWGVLKAGGAYMVIDPSLPAQRLAALLASAGAAVVVTRGDLAGGLPALGPQVVALDSDARLLAEQPADDLPPIALGSNLAYVLFTSGSTGVPKGVEIEHRQLTNYLRAISEVMDLPSGSGFAMVSTFAADLGNTVFFPALCNGGRLYLATEERAADPEALAADFARFGVDCLKIVPSHLAALLGAVRPQRLLPRSLLILGGEALSWELAASVQELAPGCRLLNHYGPTETTVGVMTFPVASGQRSPFAMGVPLGRPLANVQIYLLDEVGHPVPIGVPGELYVGGASLARGYLDAPGLTAERFLPDPFGDRPGGRLYRTGDRARFLPDRNAEFLGRADQQLKIHGFRVEPGEVTANLKAHPEVRDAVVVAREAEDTVGNPLVAYVVARGREGALDGERPYRLPNGLDVFHLNKNETLHLYRQIFEDQIYLRHGIELADGSCVFDVGANIGLFSLFVHQACRNPRVYAFEPSPVTFEKLRRNMLHHRLDAQLHQAGIADTPGTATFTFYPRVSVMSGFHADTVEEEALFRDFLANQERAGEPGAALLLDQADELVAGRFERQEFICGLTTLSDVIREHGIERIDLLKVDVEKSELQVFAGIATEDWSRIRQVVVEVHDVADRLERITGLLESQGFEVTLEQDDTLGETGIFHLYAARPATGHRAAARPVQALASIGTARDPLSANELREFLRGRLPEPMIPGAFVFLPALPLTRNGKVDRPALPDPRQATAEARLPASPRTREERLLAEIWGEAWACRGWGSMTTSSSWAETPS